MKSDFEKEKIIEELLLENYDAYYRLAYSYVHNDADAGDIVQNGAYRAIRSSSGLQQPEYAATWVYRIMLHEIFRVCGSGGAKVISLEEAALEQGREDAYENIDLQRAIEQLSPQDQAVIRLRFFEDMKLEDIAAVLDENISTTKSRLYRSVKKLQRYME